MRIVVFSIGMFAWLFAQAPPPDTEVYLAAFSASGAHVTIGPPQNISNNPGYDNQPSFSPDGRHLLFTSVRGGRKPDPANSAATGSDIYRFDIAAGRLTQVTDTPESEYSPTVMPDKRHISAVRVEADRTQRLWRFTEDGRHPELVLTEIKPVGYHAWIDQDRLALFVLGEPPTLQIADVRTGKAEVVANAIGRSLQRMPDGRISFVQRETGADAKVVALVVSAVDPGTRRVSPLVRAPAGTAEADVAWTPDGLMLMAHGDKLYGWRPGNDAMTIVADLEALGLSGATRLAVSPTSDRLAVVARSR